MADFKALARLPQIRERFKRAMNMKVVTDKSGHGFQFRLPGFKYDDFDRAGFVSPTRLNKAMETFRFVKATSFSFEQTYSGNRLFYLLGSHLVISNTLYENAALNLPLRFDGRPIRAGKTSADLYHRLFLDPTNPSEDMRFYVPKEENFLASRLLRTVCVDRVNQKPAELPEEARAIVAEAARCASEYGAVSEFPEVKLPSEITTDAFTSQAYPRFSDMDCYFHINQGSYLEFCLDAAARACRAGALPRFGTEDICFRKVRTVTSLYSTECFPTENLSVATWEDPKDPSVALYFVVKRVKDEQLVYRAKFVFQPPEEHN